ncbi:protein YgfX [Xenorhabdus stockiae]|uniref:protein YgfX n=1 Tax=Xenorhabdus stockiae TaxID=351614 RepID=UPI003CF489AD
MALWNSKLRLSRQTRWFSSCVHGMIALAALFAPWPAKNFYFGFPVLVIPILVMIMVSWVRSQKNIQQCQGRLILLKGNKVHWQNARWEMTQPPWFSRYGMMLSLCAFEQPEDFRHKSAIRLWVASDSMPPEMWRYLNQLMRQYPDT